MAAPYLEPRLLKVLFYMLTSEIRNQQKHKTNLQPKYLALYIGLPTLLPQIPPPLTCTLMIYPRSPFIIQISGPINPCLNELYHFLPAPCEEQVSFICFKRMLCSHIIGLSKENMMSLDSTPYNLRTVPHQDF